MPTSRAAALGAVRAEDCHAESVGSTKAMPFQTVPGEKQQNTIWTQKAMSTLFILQQLKYFECIGMWKLVSSEPRLNLLDEYLKHVKKFFCEQSVPGISVHKIFSI